MVRLGSGLGMTWVKDSRQIFHLAVQQPEVTETSMRLCWPTEFAFRDTLVFNGADREVDFSASGQRLFLIF